MLGGKFLLCRRLGPTELYTKVNYPPAAGEIHESAVSKMSRSLKLDIAIRQVTMYNFRQVILTPTGF